MRLRVWNAVIVSFGLLALISPASADFHTDSEARFALLGPRIEAGLIWDVDGDRTKASARLRSGRCEKESPESLKR